MIPSRTQIAEDRYWGRGTQPPTPPPPPKAATQPAQPSQRGRTEAARAAYAARVQRIAERKQQQREQVLADRKAQVAPTGHAVRHADVPLGLLLVEQYAEGKYQRPMDTDWVLREAERFEWEQFGELVVVPLGDGSYAVVDGQHRKAMLDVLLFPASTPVPCEILPPLPYEERARMFRVRNERRRQMSLGLLLRAKLEEGDPDVQDFVFTAKRLGFRIDWTHRESQAFELLRSPSSAWFIFRRWGSVVFARTLRVLRTALADSPEPEKVITHQTLVGTATFLARYGEHPVFDEKQFLERLHRAGTQGVWAAAAEAAPRNVRSQAVYWTIGLVAMYNYRRPERTRLPDWTTDRKELSAIARYRVAKPELQYAAEPAQ